MDLNTIIVASISTIINAATLYYFQRKQAKIERIQNNHHTFLLAAKNDVLPILEKRVSELEDQILPPEDHKNDMH